MYHLYFSRNHIPYKKRFYLNRPSSYKKFFSSYEYQKKDRHYGIQMNFKEEEEKSNYSVKLNFEEEDKKPEEDVISNTSCASKISENYTFHFLIKKKYLNFIISKYEYNNLFKVEIFDSETRISIEKLNSLEISFFFVIKSKKFINLTEEKTCIELDLDNLELIKILYKNN
ncbi:2443_t:CDS:1, partial [Gigaspora margarita]